MIFEIQFIYMEKHVFKRVICCSSRSSNEEYSIYVVEFEWRRNWYDWKWVSTIIREVSNSKNSKVNLLTIFRTKNDTTIETTVDTQQPIISSSDDDDDSDDDLLYASQNRQNQNVNRNELDKYLEENVIDKKISLENSQLELI